MGAVPLGVLLDTCEAFKNDFAGAVAEQREVNKANVKNLQKTFAELQSNNAENAMLITSPFHVAPQYPLKKFVVGQNVKLINVLKEAQKVAAVDCQHRLISLYLLSSVENAPFPELRDQLVFVVCYFNTSHITRSEIFMNLNASSSAADSTSKADHLGSQFRNGVHISNGKFAKRAPIDALAQYVKFHTALGSFMGLHGVETNHISSAFGQRDGIDFVGMEDAQRKIIAGMLVDFLQKVAGDLVFNDEKFGGFAKGGTLKVLLSGAMHCLKLVQDVKVSFDPISTRKTMEIIFAPVFTDFIENHEAMKAKMKKGAGASSVIGDVKRDFYAAIEKHFASYIDAGMKV